MCYKTFVLNNRTLVHLLACFCEVGRNETRQRKPMRKHEENMDRNGAARWQRDPLLRNPSELKKKKDLMQGIKPGFSFFTEDRVKKPVIG